MSYTARPFRPDGTTHAPNQDGEIKPLTSFRFLAVCAVFLSHLAFFASRPDLQPIYDRWFYEGYTGVTFFFVLSGFILTYKYRERLRSFNPRELKRFYISRIARIYPVQCLTFLIALPLVYDKAWPQDWIVEGLKALSNLALLQSLSPNISYYYAFNGPAWSLSDEVFFYALFPFAILLLSRIRGNSPWRWAALGIGLWATAFTVVFQFRDIESSHWFFYISPFFRLFDFMLGVILCQVFLRLGTIQGTKTIFTILELAGLGALGTAVYFSPLVHQSLRYGVYYTPFICLVVLVFALRRGYLSDLLSHRVLVLLGEISFSFYLLHQLVIRYLVTTDVIGSNPILAAAIAFSVALGLSYISFWLYESPARRKIRQMLDAGTPHASRLALPAEPALAQPSGSGPRMRYLIPVALLSVAASALVLCYPSLRLGFLGEAWTSIDMAARLTPLQFLSQTTLLGGQGIDYGPLSGLIFYIQHGFFGADPLGYHIVSILLHLAGALALFWTVFEISGNFTVATISALTFVGLPVYAQTIFNLVDPQVQISTLVVPAIWAWARFLRTGKMRYYGLALGAFALALAAGQPGILLPASLFLVDRMLIRESRNVRRSVSQALQRYAPFGLLAVLAWAAGLGLRGTSAPMSDIIANLGEYLALEIFPWGMQSPVLVLGTGAVIAVYIYRVARRRNAILVFFGVETLLLLVPFVLSPRDEFTARYLYLPAMLFAVAFALVLAWLMQASLAPPRHLRTAGAGAVALIVLANGLGTGNAAAAWSAVVRKTRQPYREISAARPNLPADTRLYFIDPPSTRDLRGIFFARYGNQVSVGSSWDNYRNNTVPYPSLNKDRQERATDVSAIQIADLRDHKAAFVYYFNAEGKSIEVPVSAEAVTRTAPSLPIIFGSAIKLEGYELARNSFRPDQGLVLLLYWRALGKVGRDYTVFVHLVDANGAMVDGYDSLPASGKAPTSSWIPGALVVDSIIMPVTADVPRGSNYRLELGLYYRPTMERLPAVDEHGASAGDQIIIEPFEIQ